MSWPILVCLVLAVGFGTAIPWAIRADRADAHLLHQTGSGYPGCSCPAWRYHPRHPKPTNPNCPQPGTKEDSA